MADEKEAQDSAQQEGGKAPKSGIPKIVIMLIALSVAVMALTPVITIYAFRMMSKKAAPPVEEKKVLYTITLPKIQFMVEGTSGTRFGQCEILVEYDDLAMKPLFEPQSDANPDGIGKRIQARILDLLSSKSLNVLLARDGKQKVCEEIQVVLNEMFEGKTDGMVTSVSFITFLIQ